MKTKRKLSNISVSLVLMLIFALFLVRIMFNTVDAYFTKKKVQEEIAKIEADIEKYEAEKEKFKENINDFSEEETVEKIARDKLNLKKEGEVTYKIVD